MRVRIAQNLWKQTEAAATVEEARACVKIPWVEIDGVRYDNVLEANVEMIQGFQILTLKMYAVADILLLNDEGEIVE